MLTSNLYFLTNFSWLLVNKRLLTGEVNLEELVFISFYCSWKCLIFLLIFFHNGTSSNKKKKHQLTDSFPLGITVQTFGGCRRKKVWCPNVWQLMPREENPYFFPPVTKDMNFQIQHISLFLLSSKPGSEILSFGNWWSSCIWSSSNLLSSPNIRTTTTPKEKT